MGNKSTNALTIGTALGSSTDTSALLQPSPTNQPPLLAMSSANTRIAWQQETQKNTREAESYMEEELGWMWILITMASTFCFISIIPIGLLIILTRPGALPDDSLTTGLVARSLQLETQPWNYESLCQPRKGQCQLGTYTSKSINYAEISWYDEDCRKIADGALIPAEEMLVLTESGDLDRHPLALLVKSQDSGYYLDVPYIKYRDKMYSQYHNTVDRWFGPDADDEHFSLLWFDC